MKKLIFCLSLFIAIGLSGCGTLDKSGAYNGDKILYVADQTDVTAYNVIHQFVLFEYENRALLASHPEIKSAADEIRKNAPDWFAKYDQARSLYVTVNTPDNLARFQVAIQVLKDGVAKATDFLFQSQAIVKK